MAKTEVSFKRLGLELVVIFLAVTAGFLGDDYREYLNDRRQETDILRQLSDDLALDSADIAPIVRPSRHRGDVMLWLNNRAHGPRPSEDSLTAAIDTLGQDIYFTYEASAHTYSSLRGSGGLRLIRDASLRDSIVFYYEDRVPVLEEFNADAEDRELEWWERAAPYIDFQPAQALRAWPRVRVVDAAGFWGDRRLRYATMQMGGWYESQTEVAESMLQMNHSLRMAIGEQLAR